MCADRGGANGMHCTDVMAIHGQLEPLAAIIGGAMEISALAFIRVAEKLAAAGKPVAELTLGEAAALIEAAAKEFDADWQRWLAREIRKKAAK